jgi:hypothetical protein|tara:strand:- start:50 stop:247 length:198 start_codon:yes stop_codon:yes gene_type:complete
MDIDKEERLSFIAALEESVGRKIAELTEKQADTTIKYQHLQGLKDSIYRQKRQIATMREQIKLIN